MPAFTSFLLAAAVGAQVAGTVKQISAAKKAQKTQSAALDSQTKVLQQQADAAKAQVQIAQQEQSNMQKQLQMQQDQLASETESLNNSTKKSADVSSIVDSIRKKNEQGLSSTMLTSPQGIDLASLTLDKKTILGG